MMTSFWVMKFKFNYRMIRMMVKDSKINKKTMNSMTKIWIKATKTFNFNLKRITVINLSETTRLKKILAKAKRKKINYHP